MGSFVMQPGDSLTVTCTLTDEYGTKHDLTLTEIKLTTIPLEVTTMTDDTRMYIPGRTTKITLSADWNPPGGFVLFGQRVYWTDG